ncbi:hypothetical protein D5R40_26830 [Okeania hirsuta]|uniref:Uncharacterized protein n=1 Tax=Okeania hirsuta TaxID=1458930 RepID=A0A3N6P539_9CYAN|nr:hypothetical protein D5R40_26830 [Okeania hirsuta]
MRSTSIQFAATTPRFQIRLGELPSLLTHKDALVETDATPLLKQLDLPDQLQQIDRQLLEVSRACIGKTMGVHARSYQTEWEKPKMWSTEEAI